jgi:hypothetical protein
MPPKKIKTPTRTFGVAIPRALTPYMDIKNMPETSQSSVLESALTAYLLRMTGDPMEKGLQDYDVSPVMMAVSGHLCVLLWFEAVQAVRHYGVQYHWPQPFRHDHTRLLTCLRFEVE